MVKSRAFFGFLSLVIVVSIAGILALEYAKAERSDFRKRFKSLEWELSILEARTKPVKRMAETRLKIQKVLEKFATRLNEDPKMISELIHNQSAQHGIDPLLIMAVIQTESSFRRQAVSRKGAVGLMQLRPFTARSIAAEVDVSYTHRRNLTDSKLNITLGSYYLAKMRQRFGDFTLALEAYNRGPSRLKSQIRRGYKIRHVYSNRVMYNYDKFQEFYSQL